MGLVVAGAGCTLEDDAEDGDAQQDELRNGGPTCRTCGYSNSPLLGEPALDAFAVPGSAPPPSGFQLIGIAEPNGTLRDVTVDGDQFVASKHGKNRKGRQLIGWSLIFQDGGGKRYEVEIGRFAATPNWATGEPVPSYTLLYVDPEDPEADPNLCKGLDPDYPSIVLLGGELYDADTKSVLPGQPGVVTLACHGHALAKLRMLGYGPNDSLGATPAQRQAALKMLTADYCGDGFSFTDVGQPLDWADELNTFDPGINDPERVEANWTSSGASCLDEPRARPRELVEARCDIPRCNGHYLAESGDVWASFHP